LQNKLMGFLGVFVTWWLRTKFIGETASDP